MHSGVRVHFVPLTQGLMSQASSLDVTGQCCPNAEHRCRSQCMELCAGGVVGTWTTLPWAVLGWAHVNARCSEAPRHSSHGGLGTVFSACHVSASALSALFSF